MGNTLDASLLCRNKFLALELKKCAKANITVIPYYLTLLDFLIFEEECLSKKISTDNSPQSSSNLNIFWSFKVFFKPSQQKQTSRIVKQFQIWQCCVSSIWYIRFRSKIDFRQLLNFVGDDVLIRCSNLSQSCIMFRKSIHFQKRKQQKKYVQTFLWYNNLEIWKRNLMSILETLYTSCLTSFGKTYNLES